jgi:hypothetical protein
VTVADTPSGLAANELRLHMVRRHLWSPEVIDGHTNAEVEDLHQWEHEHGWEHVT